MAACAKIFKRGEIASPKKTTFLQPTKQVKRQNITQAGKRWARVIIRAGAADRKQGTDPDPDQQHLTAKAMAPDGPCTCELYHGQDHTLSGPSRAA